MGLALFASGGEHAQAEADEVRHSGGGREQATNAVVQPVRVTTTTAKFETGPGLADHVPVPPAFRTLHDTVGLLGAPASGRVCTAFCVSPDIIATAAHCVADDHVSGRSGPKEMSADRYVRVFELGLAGDRRRARIGNFERGASNVGAEETNNFALGRSVDIANDWALARLTVPICSNATLALSSRTLEEVELSSSDHMIFVVTPSVSVVPPPKGGPVEIDRQSLDNATPKTAVDRKVLTQRGDIPNWTLFASPPCRLAARGFSPTWEQTEDGSTLRSRVMLHNCDLGKGSSGSPLLMSTPNGLEIVGIGVGRYKRSLVTLRDARVAERFDSHHVASAAIAASVLRRPLRRLQSSKTVAP